MAKRRSVSHHTVLNAGTIVNVGAIVFSFVATMGGFYFLTKDELARHDTAISTTIPTEIKAEADAREKARNEFLDKLGKLNDGIGVLNSHAAVQDEQNKQIATTLGKISDQLANGLRR